MGRLFGTDGIRGIANQTLTREMAMDIGAAAFDVSTGTLAEELGPGTYDNVVILVK